MTEHQVIRRTEMLDARLKLGRTTIELADYAATGLLATAIAARGNGKTNVGLCIAEQLSEQGWVSVIIDPEEELAALYGGAVADPETLALRLRERDQPIVVVAARNADEFIPFAKAILTEADTSRKPVFVMVDEGQLFSSPTRHKGAIGEASALLDEFAGRGRKRALDAFITALRPTASLSRTIFASRSLTLIGCQPDPQAWAALAPQCRAAQLTYSDLSRLTPGEFFCFSHHGVTRVRLPLAAGLRGAALKVKPVVRTLPGNFKEWSRAMESIPTERLQALTGPVVQLLGTIAGLTGAQMATGTAALQDELDSRA